MAKEPKRKRVYSEYDKKLQATPNEVRKRVARNKARRNAIKAGTVKKGDGVDMHHPKGGARGKAVPMKRTTNRAKK